MAILCEVCGKEPATAFSFFGIRRDQKLSVLLAGACVVNTEEYYIEFKQWDDDIERWGNQLAEKNWFDCSTMEDALNRYDHARRLAVDIRCQCEHCRRYWATVENNGESTGANNLDR
jgi:hypothetical protein